jgi:hypothetical protein
MVPIAHLLLEVQSNESENSRNPSSSKHPLSPIYPIRGGGDYRGIYDIGFKRGFMGYRGLLLNAPYKIDSMVWMRCG